MYNRRYCCGPVARRQTPPVCVTTCRTTVPDTATAVPESVRLATQLGCLTYVRPATSSSGCDTFIGGGNNVVRTPVQTYTAAPIPVRTLPASATTALRAIQTVTASQNPSNPDTRFEQYFRPRMAAPLAIVCPERVPRNEPAGPNPVQNCVPTGRFQTSAAQAAAAGV